MNVKLPLSAWPVPQGGFCTIIHDGRKYDHTDKRTAAGIAVVYGPTHAETMHRTRAVCAALEALEPPNNPAGGCGDG